MYKLTDLYKQLKEEETEPQQQYKIYCDMDGVLTNFEGRFKSLNPEHLSPAQYQAKYGIEKFWNYIKDKQPTLLSAPSRKNESRLGKRLWVKNNIPGTKLILSAADKKQNYSKPDTILIDDRPDNIHQWRLRGGIGILHTNTQDTIKQL